MNLCEPGILKAFLQRHGLTAKKGLGQHFLCSQPVVDAIVRCVDGYGGVLEIGPGPGILTSPLTARVGKVIALEVDPTMIEALAESAPAADVRQVDALKADISSILQELPEPRAVVSNLPYYITGPLLTAVAGARDSLGKAVLMMQKEVALRVLAGPRDSLRGSLSVFLQSQFQIRKVAQAPAGAFLPPPKVDSTVLEFMPLPTQYSDAFFRLVRVGFTQPRKTLVNNLLGLGLSRDQAMAAVEAAGLGEKARPQELSLAEWVRLSESLAS